mmetsp:Transcript_28398/g.44300  ORF Transcript_28398/g.44300 Transcript_28398/m.44300 type:complete len:315 (-) Transcript_28398:249-1193(-)
MEQTIGESCLTEDIPGTMDPITLTSVLQAAGMQPMKSRCGKNCLKLDRGTFKVMYYNKVVESLQQGKARSDAVDDKLYRLLDPSTQGLQSVFTSEVYNRNGITRMELTFHLDEGHLWTLDDMQRRMNEFRPLPRTFDVKRRQYFMAHPRSREATAKDLNTMHDTVIVRWFNSLTEMFLCVAGMEKYYDEDDTLKNIYFRRVALVREATPPKQLLQTYFLSNGAVNAQWSDINVDGDMLVPLRPQVISKDHVKYEEIQTTLDLAPDAVLAEEEPVASEALEKCSGLRRRTEAARENNMPKQFTPLMTELARALQI